LKTENRKQKTGNGKPKTETRKQKAEHRKGLQLCWPAAAQQT